jgi:hypothetical protein
MVRSPSLVPVLEEYLKTAVVGGKEHHKPLSLRPKHPGRED